jgi:phosphatidate cytidylyltransferase
MFLNLQKLEIIFVLLLAVVSDTGAYYTGTYLGDKRIWPQISPNKSWAGAIGGLVFTVIICLIFGLFWGKANWYSWILVATVLNIAAQLGDFFESALKRLLQVKDSGNLLPGHGGLLDRIDSILLVLPVYVFLKTFLQLFNTT